MVLLGATLRLFAYFREKLEDDIVGDLIDPDSVNISISLNDSVIVTSSASQQDVGIYYYDFTPENEGSYTFEFVGELDSGNLSVTGEFDVIVDTATPSTSLLGDEVVITFSSGYDPMYADPEYVSAFFNGDVSLVEIAEIIHRHSLEVLNWVGSDTPNEAYEYVVAATLCTLGRKYLGYLDGMLSGKSVTLGDLSVQENSGSGSQQGTTRGTATNWCEYAEVLRRTLRMSTGSMTSAVKAIGYTNPIQPRTSTLLRGRR